MDVKKILIATATLALCFSSAIYAAETAETSTAVTTTTNGTTEAAAKPVTMKLTSAEMGTLATIAVIDKDEILLAVVANNKNPSSGVADFARMMIDQHGSNLTQILQMAGEMHATSLKGGEAETLKEKGMKEMLMLGGMPQGAQFEMAYADAMVKGHQGALDLIDTKLMKTAKSDQMKTFLTDTRNVVAQHLEAAKKLQDSLKS